MKPEKQQEQENLAKDLKNLKTRKRIRKKPQNKKRITWYQHSFFLVREIKSLDNKHKNL